MARTTSGCECGQIKQHLGLEQPERVPELEPKAAAAAAAGCCELPAGGGGLEPAGP